MNKSKLFKTAWAIADKFDTFAQALKQAWQIIKLAAKMMAGNVRFSYRKVSGEVREAVGTLSVKMEVKGTGRPSPVDSFLYYDTEALWWRSFKITNLI